MALMRSVRAMLPALVALLAPRIVSVAAVASPPPLDPPMPPAPPLPPLYPHRTVQCSLNILFVFKDDAERIAFLESPAYWNPFGGPSFNGGDKTVIVAMNDASRMIPSEYSPYPGYPREVAINCCDNEQTDNLASWRLHRLHRRHPRPPLHRPRSNFRGTGLAKSML